MDARGRLAQLPAQAKTRRNDHYQQTELDVDLFAVEKVDRVVLEIRIGKDPVDEEERGGPVRREMERLPFLSADTMRQRLWRYRIVRGAELRAGPRRNLRH